MHHRPPIILRPRIIHRQAIITGLHRDEQLAPIVERAEIGAQAVRVNIGQQSFDR
jgi:hypothetical protein